MLLNTLTPLALLVSGAAALNEIAVAGSNFVDSVTKDRFEVVGVAYQPGGSAGFSNSTDPLADSSACLRDAILMQQLGVNTIRVYNLDPGANHDECAAIFNAAGIYMIIDVNSPLSGQSLDASDPSSTYDSSYLEHIFQVVEAFKGYSNLIGFFAGNEVINTLSTGGTDPPYIRAVVRDLKNYIAKHGGRTIPVGYSAADVRQILFDTWAYMQCAENGTDSDPSRIDFFGLNSYSWCGDSATFETSGYNTMVSGFADTSVPVFFSEYGCNKVLPRTFPEIPTIYGTEMTAVMSGGLVYEWTQETNNYGLVQVNSNNTLTLLGDYTALQSQLGKIDLSAITKPNSTATAQKPPSCTSSLIKESGFSTNFNLPSIPSGAQTYIDNGVKGAHTGGSVSVSSTKMPTTVYDSNGSEMSNLELKVVSSSNTPNETTTGSSSAASSSSAAIANVPGLHATEGVFAAGLLGLFFL